VKPKQPAAPGWFSYEGATPHLVGTRCTACGTYFFPKEAFFCRNRVCASSQLEEVALSRRGRLWSYTNNCYAPPPPFVASDPFEPYAVAAVELEKERMVVLGQVEAGVAVAELEIGMPMELTVGRLYENAESEFVIWKWRPLPAEGRA
jgi:uncharacterized OB-fold protein